MEMIFFVLNDPDLMDEVLEGWQKIGVSGATIFETTGFHRRMKKRIPMRYIFGESMIEETGNITLMALVSNNELVQQCLAVTEQIVGDLNLPNTGVFASWTIPFVKGLSKNKKEE
jgi:nitrogen regulatory protein PII